MSRNFRPHESRGFSSMWMPAQGDAVPSSDAPTRPVSVFQAHFTENEEANQMSIVDQNLETSRNPYSHLANSELGDISQIPSMPQNVQDTLLPPPRQALNMNAELREHRLDPSGAPLSMADQSFFQEVPVGDEQRQKMVEVYQDLTRSGFKMLEVPRAMPPNLVFRAFEYYFSRVAPLPRGYVSGPEACLELLEILGYIEPSTILGEESTVKGSPGVSRDSLGFALRMSHRFSAWPLVLNALYWCYQETKGLDDLPSVLDFESSGQLDFRAYLERSILSALVIQRSHGTIPSDFFFEIRTSLAQVAADTKAEIEEREQHLSSLKEQNAKLRSMFKAETQEVNREAVLLAKIEQQQTRNTEMERKIEAASKNISKLEEDVFRNQSNIDEQERNIEDVCIQMATNSQRISGNTPDPASVLELAQKFDALLVNAEESSKTLAATRETVLETIERPARKQFTTIRIKLDDYNDGLIGGGEEILEKMHIESKLPRSLADVFGKSEQSLLNLSRDIGSVKREWLQIIEEFREAIVNFEDSTGALNAEIQGLASRKERHKVSLDDLEANLKELNSKRDSLHEKIAQLKYQQESQVHDSENYNVKIEKLSQTIFELEKEIEESRSQLASNEPEVAKCSREQLDIEANMRKHSLIWQELNEKTEEFEQAKEIYKDTVEQAGLRVIEYKPAPVPAGYLPSLSPKERAEQLLRSAGRI